MQRPTSLTVVGWVLIIFGAFGLLATAMMPKNPAVTELLADSPLPLSAHLAIGAVGALVSMICGYGILKGLGWSRMLYVGWTVISIAIALFSMPFTTLAAVGWAIQAVIIFLLFRPAANAWLGGTGAAVAE